MDTEAVFNDDYLYFYAERLDAAHPAGARRGRQGAPAGAGFGDVRGYGDGGAPLTMESRRMVVTGSR
ncbi:hypothetical protein [Phytohabitans houttuyneae]|uniref:Uncharacterized protein n=1 Tax=Phytohabitans houttuyneae TaxID=1076126 RepID=A0A6V8KGT6_9ACTN|nr:hypothetical protein [Phytohabitans houttuyneae]GFJ83044.1 hypothetical protein Phou_072240 [Phytohabitans houttuyneae]